MVADGCVLRLCELPVAVALHGLASAALMGLHAFALATPPGTPGRRTTQLALRLRLDDVVSPACWLGLASMRIKVCVLPPMALHGPGCHRAHPDVERFWRTRPRSGPHQAQTRNGLQATM